jgi:hypothetical protein
LWSNQRAAELTRPHDLSSVFEIFFEAFDLSSLSGVGMVCMAGALPGTTRPELLITNWLKATKTFEVQGQFGWDFPRVSVEVESESRKEVLG